MDYKYIEQHENGFGRGKRWREGVGVGDKEQNRSSKDFVISKPECKGSLPPSLPMYITRAYVKCRGLAGRV